jgi:hypothetical protein
MPGANVAPDSTIETIQHRLSDRVDYVRHVFNEMAKAEKKIGPAFVRIGITGEGLFPNYRIEGIADALWGPYNGRNHEIMQRDNLQNDTWSTARMSYEAVVKLLREIAAVK